MLPEAQTQLILSRIDAAERAVNTRIEDVILSQAKLTEAVEVAARDALTGRLIAEEAKIKVGQVHEVQKRTTSAVEKLVAAESALTKYAGAPIRWKFLTVFIAGVAALEWLLHRFVLRS